MLQLAKFALEISLVSSFKYITEKKVKHERIF